MYKSSFHRDCMAQEVKKKISEKSQSNPQREKSPYSEFF